MTEAVERYLDLGLALGRHIDGLVDAYYGPPALAQRVAAEPLRPPARLAADLRTLVADLDADASLDPARRHWLRAQVLGLRTVAEKLAGEPIAYRDEVERCYGVRPAAVSDDELAAAHKWLDAALPGGGPLAERYAAWLERYTVPPEKLDAAVRSIAEDLRERTQQQFGLPDGEHVQFELVTDQPWSGFNYYEGGLRSRVAINTDLPVMSHSLGRLVAHEAYPGHHTEHCRKEVGLVRRRHLLEETIFLVGTPQCLVAEGLADLALDVAVGPEPQAWLAGHLAPLGVPYDPDGHRAVAEAGEVLARARGNVGLLLHEDGADPDDAVAWVERWLLLPPPRAEKAVQFQTDPTWRAYVTCYVEGYPRCRAFVGGDPARFERLITEQVTPEELVAA